MSTCNGKPRRHQGLKRTHAGASVWPKITQKVEDIQTSVEDRGRRKCVLGQPSEYKTYTKNTLRTPGHMFWCFDVWTNALLEEHFWALQHVQ